MIHANYRAARESDIPFLFSTWIKHQRYQGFNQDIPWSTYYANEKRKVAQVLAKSSVTIIHNPDDDDQIYGWVCYQLVKDLLVIHYSYVKRPYQRLGLLKACLIKAYPDFGRSEVAITAMSREIAHLLERHRLIYNPYLKETL